MSGKKKPTQYQKRLLDQIQSVQDENLQELISECIWLEFKHKSEFNFPMRNVKDLIEKYADLLEGEGSNEV